MLELAIALAVWMVLSIGIFLLWQHTSNASVRLLTRQSAVENARAAMDALVMNIQMSNNIVLETNNANVLRRLTLTERNPQGILHDYIFEFTPGGNGRLLFGANEFASGIASIYIVYVPGRRFNITVYTTCEEPFVVRGSVDARYKNVTVVVR